MVPLAFEVEDGVHHVFENPWSGNGTFFRHMTNDKNRQVEWFGEGHELSRTLPHLAYTPRGRGDVSGENRLDGVDQPVALEGAAQTRTG